MTEFSGFIFGFLSLLSDSFVSHFQKNLKKKVKYSYLDLTLGMNLYLFFFTLLISITNNELLKILNFFYWYPSSFFDILTNNVFLISGLFILFYHLHHFGPVSVAYITTFRKIVTITLSIVIYSHPMNTFHTIGLTIVFITILMDFKRNLNKKKIKKVETSNKKIQ